MNPEFDSEQLKWEAVQRRDAAADACFLYGVTTTGIYCYPSCPSREARREHTRFYRSREEARQDGMRACQRCHSDQPPLRERQRQLVEQACEWISSSTEPVRVASLAEHLGISRYHLQKLFQQFLGIGPKQYVKAVRARNLDKALSSEPSVTRALLDAGYDSSSAYYADGASRLGMSARSYQRQGEGMSIQYAFGNSRFGKIVVATTEHGICSILFGTRQRQMQQDLAERFRRATLIHNRQALKQLVDQVIAGIENPSLAATLPLDVQGTAFQEKVWAALRQIAPGSTESYSQLAARIGRPTAARAVARACGANPVAVLVPCHRVVGADGSITGYRWGVERKQRLLAHESQDEQ
ncbi:bifunctional DNA-binding transcriptional regulator/O6-methylguanine-DNA methyltransferase Ada [Granulosicoccus sp. 3-233]|uniref:bifunctional DNA-binding transcriptional regulator/O6-methylguanine-DNA methyltransferase Ada n=1 Tax=Granulosicoccus sp. 3-233 TaxID=3417969 RepID=UPI003D32F545